MKTLLKINNLKRFLAAVTINLILLTGSGALLANSTRIFPLTAEEWSRPRSGPVIPHMQALVSAVSYWESLQDAQIMLTHPGGDSGEIWASELRDWLVSLGIPKDQVMLTPGLQVESEIRILVGMPGELNR